MNSSSQNNLAVKNAYDTFLSDVSALQSQYGDTFISEYLSKYRPRISAQIEKQLAILACDGTASGKMLSIGGWPGITPIILNRLTGIDITLIDHPALLTDPLRQFYADQGLKVVAFDFADAATKPIPLSEKYQFIECCECIEHWNFNPIPIFKQIFSCLLDPAGSMFITVPNATGLYRRLSVFLGQTPYPGMQDFINVDEKKPGAEVSPHWREYTRKDLQQLITHCLGHCTELHMASYRIIAKNSWQHHIYSMFNNLHLGFREFVEVVCKANPST